MAPEGSNGFFPARKPDKSGPRGPFDAAPMIKRLLFVPLALASAALHAADWTEFRGPGAQGHSDATGLPVLRGTLDARETTLLTVAVDGRLYLSLNHI